MDDVALIKPPLKSSQVIFAVTDVLATAKFYQEVLGFESKWLWGEPPTFAGLNWGRVQVMLCKQPELAGKIEGHQHFFFCEDVNAMFERHKANHAPVIEEIGNKPWGMREYTIRDINGYHLRFTGSANYERPATARSLMPGFIRIVERMPTVEEFAELTDAVGWNRNGQTIPAALQDSLYGVVAVDSREESKERVVGLIRLVGDGARFFYLQDVMVLPELQHQKIGSAMMEAVMVWLKTNAPKGAFIGLFTGKEKFYEGFGFKSGGGMSLEI